MHDPSRPYTAFFQNDSALPSGSLTYLSLGYSVWALGVAGHHMGSKALSVPARLCSSIFRLLPLGSFSAVSRSNHKTLRIDHMVPISVQHMKTIMLAVLASSLIGRLHRQQCREMLIGQFAMCQRNAFVIEVTHRK